MRRIHVITFDAGGTLLFPHPSVGAVYAEVAAAHGLALDAVALEDAFRAAWHSAHRPQGPSSEHIERQWWRDVVRRTLAPFEPPRDFDAYFEALWLTFAAPHRWRLSDDAHTVLTRLREAGYRLGILSNWDGRLRGILDGFGLLPCFEHVIISSEVGCEKPDPAIFDLTCRRFACSPDEVLHVGDSAHHDVHGARRAGWHVLHLADGDPPETGAPHIRALQDIAHWLETDARSPAMAQPTTEENTP